MNNFNASDIKEHASVIASCGTQVGKVDHLEGQDSIKFIKKHQETPIKNKCLLDGCV